MPILAQIYGEVRFCAHQQVSDSILQAVIVFNLLLYVYTATYVQMHELKNAKKERKEKQSIFPRTLDQDF